MAKRKKQRPSRQFHTIAIPRPLEPRRSSALLRSITWLGSAGILVMALSATYQHFFGNITLEYAQALSRGYEFQFRNDTPSDRVVERFRVLFPEQKEIIFKITQNIPVYRGSSPDSVALPDGNIHEVPATGFKELDGRTLHANSSLKFRIPPLSDRSWAEPDATIVELQYSLAPANAVLAMVDRVLSVFDSGINTKTVRYVILANYWVPATSNSPDEAVRIACRDDSTIRKLRVCDGKR